MDQRTIGHIYLANLYREEVLDKSVPCCSNVTQKVDGHVDHTQDG